MPCHDCCTDLCLAAWQLPLWKVTMDGMSALLGHYRGRYTSIVGFQPTGWTQQRQQQATSAKCGRRSQKGSVILYQVRC
jgi:DNA cross-link repair 1A protein